MKNNTKFSVHKADCRHRTQAVLLCLGINGLVLTGSIKVEDQLQII